MLLYESTFELLNDFIAIEVPREHVGVHLASGKGAYDCIFELHVLHSVLRRASESDGVLVSVFALTHQVVIYHREACAPLLCTSEQCR